jgi:hypothetical protein
VPDRWINNSNLLNHFLSVFLSICLSVSSFTTFINFYVFSIISCLSVFLSVRLFLSFSFIFSNSIYLALSFCLSICMSVDVSLSFISQFSLKISALSLSVFLYFYMCLFPTFLCFHKQCLLYLILSMSFLLRSPLSMIILHLPICVSLYEFLYFCFTIWVFGLSICWSDFPFYVKISFFLLTNKCFGVFYLSVKYLFIFMEIFKIQMCFRLILLCLCMHISFLFEEIKGSNVFYVCSLSMYAYLFAFCDSNVFYAFSMSVYLYFFAFCED